MKEKVKNISFIIIGNVLIAWAISLLIENNIIVGGVSGLGLVANYYFGWSITLVVSTLNAVLFILGFLFLGVEFALTTLLSTLVFPLFLNFFNRYSFFAGYFNNLFFVCLLAGLMIGIGIGMVLKSHASTGGIDILALIINKFLNYPIHRVMNIIDILILVLQFSFSPFLSVIYGMMTVVLTSIMLDYTLKWKNKVMPFTFISHLYEKLGDIMLILKPSNR